MSFISTEPLYPPGSEPGDNSAPVVSDPFWPEVSLMAVRLAVGLDGSVTPERLKSKATEAVAYVNSQLAVWRAGEEASGYTSLAGVPSPQIDGVSVNVQRYLYAVASMTKALLIEGYRNIDTTREGEKHAEALVTQIDTLWRDTHWALSDIMQTPRMMSELV